MNATIRIVPCALPDREAPSIRVTAMRGLDDIPVEIPADRSEPALRWSDITGHRIRHFRPSTLIRRDHRIQQHIGAMRHVCRYRELHGRVADPADTGHENHSHGRDA